MDWTPSTSLHIYAMSIIKWKTGINKRFCNDLLWYLFVVCDKNIYTCLIRFLILFYSTVNRRLILRRPLFCKTCSSVCFSLQIFLECAILDFRSLHLCDISWQNSQSMGFTKANLLADFENILVSDNSAVFFYPN